ncbi:uncharacterized protein LOC142889524 [Nelusetta ayraudi]|uniref:uncharacterized protein LOC142889524 n=1 Tax=Nelusetta ayraudi TaxID=303726 RepID=UPI003F70FCC3
MSEAVTSSLEVNILRLYDRVILGFSDDSSVDSQDIFKKYDKAANNTKCKSILFAKAELEEATEVFKEYNVNSPPMFLFFKDGDKMDELLSNDSEQLQKKILKLMK